METTMYQEEPKTYEEWVEIHGEPEYLYETKPQPKDLMVEVEWCYQEPQEIDTTGIIDAKGKLNYSKFVDAFAQLNECVYCNGTFYNPQGAMSAVQIKKDIAESLKDFGWDTQLDKPTNSLFASLKDLYGVDRLEVDENVIPFANGDMHLEKDVWKFHLEEFKQAPYRLTANFANIDRPMPLFEKWLHDTFEDEDIPTVQEMLGYLLVPVTSAQEAFFLVGDGGVGKSVLGIILEGILGNAHRSITTQELVTQRFQISSVENKLVVYDDDLGSAALTETATLKKLITADQKIPGERKFGDPYEFRSYCKIVACANFMLSSLYDDSDGFFRRLHPIVVKPKDPNRRTIRDFGKLIVTQERDQIVRWALKGLKRVIENGWSISWSKRSRLYLTQAKNSAIHFDAFFEDVFDITYSDIDDVSSAEIIKLYARWTRDNAINAVSNQRLQKWIANNKDRLQIVTDTNLVRNNHHVRGYRGIKVKEEWQDVI